MAEEIRCTRCKRQFKSHGYMRCLDCRKYLSGYMRQYYARLKKNKLCVDCRKPSPRGTPSCDKCTDILRKKRRVYQKDRYKRLSNSGWCVRCGGERPKIPYKHCSYCLVAKREDRLRRKGTGE